MGQIILRGLRYAQAKQLALRSGALIRRQHWHPSASVVLGETGLQLATRAGTYPWSPLTIDCEDADWVAEGSISGA